MIENKAVSSGAETDAAPAGKLMSVSKMAKLLGLKKTESYWLVHKGWFETTIFLGKMWIVKDSFDKWYASQFRYRRTDGVEPGKDLQKDSLSIREIARMLELNEATVYEIIKKNQVRTITANNWMRVPVDEFEKWYAGQERYRMPEDREKDADAEAASLSMPEMAHMLGIPRKRVYSILNSARYRDCFEIIEIAGRKRITWKSFRTFLGAQDKYVLAEERVYPDCSDDSTDRQEAEVNEVSPALQELPANKYIALSKAAKLAGVSKATMSNWVKEGKISSRPAGRNLFVEWRSVERWLQKHSRM